MITKNTFGKKLLSLILSLLMVVTMLPTFAITASAAVKWTPIASSDFSSINSVSQDSGFTPSTYNGQGSTMTWTPHDYGSNASVSNGAVYIPDGYMYLSGYTGGSVPITGHSKWKLDFGFRFKTTNSGDDKYYNSNEYSFLKMYVYTANLSNPAVKNAGNCYFSQNANGVCYSWEDDGHNVGTQSQTTSITTGNGHLSANVNYHYVAEFTGDRFIAYITDDSGNIVQSIVDTTESTFISRLNNINSNTINSIKIGDDDNSNFFKGLEYRNITFYSGDITNGSSSVNNLRLLMNDYEDIMSSGTVYTNMAAAYKAYVDASEAYDAAVYGNNSTGVASAYSALSTAIANMKTWTPAAFIAPAYQHGTVATGGYDNVVFCPDSPYNNWYKTTNRGFINHAFYYPNYIVLAYDGSGVAPSFPIVYTRQNESGNRGMYAVTGWGTNLGLKQNWHGYTDVSNAGNYAFPGMTGSEIMGYTESYDTKHYMNNTKTPRGFGNKMVYDGTGDTTNYYEHLTSFSFNIRTEYYNQTKQVDYSDSNIYVINYSVVSTDVNSLRSRLSAISITDYKEGGLSAIMTAFDAFTCDKVNPNAYIDGVTIDGTNYKYTLTYNGSSITANNISTVVEKCATEIKNAHNNYASATVGTADNANNYIKLRSYLTDGLSKTFDFGNGNVTLTAKQIFENAAYNADNLANYGDATRGFYKAYKDAVDHMAALPATTNVSDYNGTTAASLATALYNAFDALSVKAQIDEPSISGEAYLGSGNTITITNESVDDGATVHYTVLYTKTDDTTESSNGSFSTASKDVTLFSANASGVVYKSAQVTAYAEKDGSPTNNVVQSFTYLKAPTIINNNTGSALINNAVFVGYTVSATSNSGIQNPVLEYSFNGTVWYDLSGNLNPFGTGGTGQTAYDNSSLDAVNLYVREKYNTSTESTSPFRIINRATAPAISLDGDYLDTDHGFTLSDRDSVNGDLKFELSTDNSNWVEFDYTDQLSGGKIKPFSIINPDNNQTVYIRARSLRNGDYSDYSTVSTVHYLSRPAVTVGGSDSVLTASDVITVTNTSGATDGLKYSIDGSDNGTAIANEGTFAPFALNTTATKLTIKVWQEKDGSKSPVYTTTVYKKPTLPNITGGEYLDKTHGVTITANDGSEDTASTIEYYCEYMGVGAWVNYSDTLVPFSGLSDSAATATATVYYRAKRTIDGKTAYSEYATYTVKYLSRPAIKNAAGTADIRAKQELLQADTVTLASTCSLATGLEYSYDGTNWNSYTTAIAPFVDNPTRLDVTIYARQKSGDSTSAVYSVKVVKNDTFYIYSYTSGKTPQYSAREFNNTSKLYVSTVALDNDTIVPYSASNQTIYYMVTVDGDADAALYEYDATNGIDVSAGAIMGYQPDLRDASVVKIVAYLCEDNGGGNVTVRDYATQTFFNSVNYNEKVLHESFNNASVSGTTLTLSDGSTATLTGGAGTASVLSGAGYVDENSNSSDWRNNVLKINANSTAPGNSIQFTQNPLADAKAAAAANTYGVTISFWRYLERNGACADLDADANDGAGTGYKWRNAIAFDDGTLNRQGYYLVEVNGVNSICKTQGNTYYDYVQENQDPTGHAAGNQRGNWVNVVITIDPTSGVTLYTNGEPHEMKANFPTKAGEFASKTDAQIAQEIIALITSGNMYFNYGDAIEGNDYDLYLDDVRIYTGVKTQLDINNMYIADDADVQTDLTSTSHDPTNVTVYTLAHSVTYTAEGVNSFDTELEKTITLAAGTTVGQEVIDFCGLSPVIGKGDVSAIDEYSFGTGMTIYHKNKTNGKWEVVGDDAGRCGYQNQKLFGSEYHTALAEPLNYAAGDNRTGAGHLVWAPHVMFNLYTGTWMYYGSTSSWGSNRSAIFVCDGSAGGSIEGPYTYRQIVYQSTAHPNAIDACVYYGYENGKPVTTQLFMAFGSWGGESAIALKTLYADGDGNNTQAYYDNKILCFGINDTLESASDGGSGEGAYIVYNNGYYYLYVSYGQNTGSYVERVYRSTSPTEGFVGFNGVSALDNSTHATHGGQILAPFDMSNHDYTFVSTGHNSVYKTVNNAGEIVTVNSAHARPLANENHSWKALPDGALATRQSEVTGNVNLVNQLAYTSNGWPVLMPYQYDGTDTVKAEITAEQLEGVYAADDLQNTEYYNWANEYTYTIVADENNPNAAYEYGVDDNGDVFKNYIVLSTGTDGTRYANYYESKDAYEANNTAVKYYGVVGKHGSKICVSMICSDDYEYTWTYRIGDVPKSEDVISLGNSVSMDGVIYTHKANDVYTKYGYEISDNPYYGQAGSTGERYTTITTTYPAKIDTTNPTAVYCLSDEALCKTGKYSGGSFSVAALNGNKWYTTNADGTVKDQYTDAEAAALSSEQQATLKRLYLLQGYVSDYYFNETTGKYADSGVELIVSYNDVETGAAYREFEFCYVTYNPAMAHTVVGIRNKHPGITEPTKYGLALFTRMEGSYGSATTLEPVAKKINATVDWKNDTSEYFGTGNFNYLYQFPNTTESVKDSNYTGAENIKNSFNYYDSKVGTNSGSFGLVEHYNNSLEGNDSYGDKAMYAASANVVNADYYVDYSDEQNSLITYESGTPKGYSFDFFASNLYWKHENDVNYTGTSADEDTVHRATSFVKNNTGINLTTSVTPTLSHAYNASVSGKDKYNYYIYTNGYNSNDADYFKVNGTGITFGAQWLLNHQGEISGTNYETILKTMTTDGTADYTKLTQGFTMIDGGHTETSGWQGRLTFSGTGFTNVNKATGNTAETAHNFAYEQGLTMKRTWWGGWGAGSEQTFQYYNIGVSTCDKGAARTFAENYLRKKLATTDNGDGTVSVKVDPNTGAPIYLDANGKETSNVNQAALITAEEFTLASYQEYIDAVAELNWFVENPTNTMFKDYKNSGSNASTKYVTAYTDAGKPIYITTVAGDNIFDKDVSNVHTDEVQAMLIKNVITAYENLFAKEDYTDAEDVYGSIQLLDGGIETSTVSDVDEIKVYSDKDAGTVAFDYSKAYYTDDSWEDFVKLVVDVASAFNYDSKKDTGKDSWRYVNLSGSEYKNLVTILKGVTDTLVPIVNVTALTDTRTAKYGNDSAGEATGTVTGGIFTDTAKTVDNKSFAAGEQVYTLASWNTLNSKCDEANTYLDSNNANYALNQKATVDGEDIVNGADNEKDFNYTQGQYAVTGVTKYTFDDVDFYARTVSNSVLSAEQTAVNTENTQLGAMALAVVDDPTCFATYDNAYTVVDSLDMDKYTAAGRTIIKNAKSNTNSVVYGTFNAAQASAYNAATGASVTAGTKLRLTTDGLTDPQSAALMTAINTVNNTKENNEYKYIKYFKVTFTQQYAGADLGIGPTVQKIMYGESVTVSADSDANLVNWSISIYDGEYADDFTAEPRASQKVSRVIGNTLTRIANNNMAIVAEVEQDSVPQGKTQYNVLDCYGNLKLVVYGTSYSISGATLTIDGNEIGIGEVPFYNLTGWEESIVGGVKTFKPVYSAKESYTITVIGGTKGTAEYDTKYTVSTDVSGFAAWATKVDGKYQIASYSPSYTFFVATNETFVPIVSDGKGGYVTTDGDEITAAKLDGEITETGSIDANTFVNNKIANRAPFVSVQRADMANKNDADKYTKARVFVRITEGCNETTSLTSYGILYRSGSTDADKEAMVIDYTADTKTYRRAVTNKLTSGQFTYTLNSTNGFKRDVTFRAYVNYNFEYTAGGTPATINALDYSSISVAKL